MTKSNTAIIIKHKKTETFSLIFFFQIYFYKKYSNLRCLYTHPQCFTLKNTFKTNKIFSIFISRSNFNKDLKHFFFKFIYRRKYIVLNSLLIKIPVSTNLSIYSFIYSEIFTILNLFFLSNNRVLKIALGK